MTGRFELSRRKLLAGVGGAGAASVGAGLGTSAYFSDTESFEGNVVTAGQLDLAVDWEMEYDGPGAVEMESGTLDGEPAVLVDLSDVKPGDTGLCTFSFSVVDNPGYLWLGGGMTANAENGQPEPEARADLTAGDIGTGKGELGRAMDATMAYDGGPELCTGSLKSVLEDVQFGMSLDADADTGPRNCYQLDEGDDIVMEWALPESVGNRVQTDEMGFAVTFYGEQCRHNDGDGNPMVDAVVPAGDSIQAAVDAAAPGDVVQLAAGTYVEQVVLDKPVTITGAGPGATVVRSPSSLSSRFVRDGDDTHPVVSLEAGGAELWNLTVDGDRQGGGNHEFVGVGAYNAGAHLGNVEVTNVSEDPLNGVQHGLGVFAYTDDGAERTVTVDGCDIHDYQKGGVVGEGAGLDLCVTYSTVTGIGPTDEIGQNGVQASGVAQAAVVGNTITDNYYTPSSQSAGLIVFQTEDVLVDRNELRDNNNGIGALAASNLTARRCNIVGNDTGALAISSSDIDVTRNWWGAPDGPAPSSIYTGGATDPVTGAVADGSGDPVFQVHWDDYADSQFDS
ncbi:right-handed parallel beta-helix repeat-containing protein [Haloarchaeobius baliensis]|uniref:right-handed parallel beta-helix repeat-containing protein n=1 Tax=Haloarchaeobius baliensis TaxID=1670458 RepID=UPI003F882B1C